MRVHTSVWRSKDGILPSRRQRSPVATATQRALSYAQHLLRHNIHAAERMRLTETEAELCTKYTSAEAKRLAIAVANEFQFTTGQIQRDIQELRRLGLLGAP